MNTFLFVVFVYIGVLSVIAVIGAMLRLRYINQNPQQMETIIGGDQVMKLLAACPVCGRTDWIVREDDGEILFECLACKELSYPEEMSLVADTEQKGD